jgi:hypothetical protein
MLRCNGTILRLKFRVFWDVAPCSCVEVDRLSRPPVLLMEAVHPSQPSDNLNMTTRRYVPQDSGLHTRPHGNLKCHNFQALYKYKCMKAENCYYSVLTVVVIYNN